MTTERDDCPHYKVSAFELFGAMYCAFLNGLAAQGQDLRAISEEGGMVQLMDRFNEIVALPRKAGCLDLSSVEAMFVVDSPVVQ